MPEIVGIDHIYIAVGDLVLAEAFYDRVFPVLGFRKSSFQIGGDDHVQYYNRDFGYVLRPARSGKEHDSYAPGLHHLCFRVESVADVTAAATALSEAGIDVSEPQNFKEYAPDYWAIFFSDPDGIRLEVTNYRQERRERYENWIST